MPAITYIHPDGRRETIEVKPGTSVMQAAVGNGVEGIVGECGGNCMCATCHVYVTPEQLARLTPPSAEESAMLESTAAERRANSRLGCQITLTAALDGLVVTVPDRQI